MKTLVSALVIFSSPVFSGTNNLDETFLEIALDCKIFRIFDSPDKSEEVYKNCINSELEKNNLSKAEYIKWSEAFNKEQQEVWDNFFESLEQK